MERFSDGGRAAPPGWRDPVFRELYAHNASVIAFELYAHAIPKHKNVSPLKIPGDQCRCAESLNV